MGTTFQNDGILKKLVTAMYKVSSKNAKVVFFENIENIEVFVNLIENDVNVINKYNIDRKYNGNIAMLIHV